MQVPFCSAGPERGRWASEGRRGLTWLSEHLGAEGGYCEQQAQEGSGDLHVAARGFKLQRGSCWSLDWSQPLCSSTGSACLLLNNREGGVHERVRLAPGGILLNE